LIFSLVKRDVIGRYRGSVMGLLWSFFNPLLMLAVYTFVFGVVFQASWTEGSESKVEFALVLFAGMLVFSLFSECLSRAPGLILGNVNYVKKVVFPLEILPVVVLGSAFFHFLVGLVVWLIFYLLFFGIPSPTILQLPLLILPLILMTLGFSWFLASLGVYLRDVGQIIGVVITVLMFLSPIFYPIDRWPEALRPFMHISPLTFVVEQARSTMIWGKSIDGVAWLIYMAISTFVTWFGFVWFQKTRKGFADVL
jgi:lipopolysaccharide transport system permease protein